MDPSLEDPKSLDKQKDDCTSENFVQKTAISKIDLKWWSKKGDFDQFYVDLSMQD